jgi:hypothetical protein
MRENMQVKYALAQNIGSDRLERCQERDRVFQIPCFLSSSKESTHSCAIAQNSSGSIVVEVVN